MEQHDVLTRPVSPWQHYNFDRCRRDVPGLELEIAEFVASALGRVAR